MIKFKKKINSSKLPKLKSFRMKLFKRKYFDIFYFDLTLKYIYRLKLKWEQHVQENNQLILVMDIKMNLLWNNQKKKVLIQPLFMNFQDL